MRTDMIHRRWRRQQPHCGGWWEWMEGGHRTPERLLLSSDGSRVATDEEWERASGRLAEHENYWEMTATDQRNMPGLWRQCRESDHA